MLTTMSSAAFTTSLGEYSIQVFKFSEHTSTVDVVVYSKQLIKPTHLCIITQ